MDTTDTSRNLQMAGSSAGGCGCGGCGCGSGAEAGADTATTAPAPESDLSTQTYAVTGMTCGHCVNAVTEELEALDGVTGVSVDLVAGGTSSVTVTSERALDRAQVVAALDEAGDYRLA